MKKPSTVDTAIKWYRTPLPREKLSALNARSDAKGLMQSLAVLAILAATGTTTLWAAFRGYWLMVPLLLFLHGTVGSFHINAVHELCHNSVFKTKALNSLFIRIFGFLGWNDWVWFNVSHANHHRYTLHPPRDGEVVLPLSWISRKNFWKAAIWQPLAPFRIVRATLCRARGLWRDDRHHPGPQLHSIRRSRVGRALGPRTRHGFHPQGCRERRNRRL